MIPANYVFSPCFSYNLSLSKKKKKKEEKSPPHLEWLNN